MQINERIRLLWSCQAHMTFNTLRPGLKQASFTGIVLSFAVSQCTPWVNTKTAIDPTQTKGRETQTLSFLAHKSASSYSKPFVCLCVCASNRLACCGERAPRYWGIPANHEFKEIRVFQLLTVFYREKKNSMFMFQRSKTPASIVVGF